MRSSDDVERVFEEDVLTRSELMKRAAALGVTLTGFGALAGAAGASPLAHDAGSTTLNVWKAPHTPTDAKFFNAQFAAYKKSNPTISVDYRVTPVGELGSDLHERLREREPPGPALRRRHLLREVRQSRASMALSGSPN